MALRGLILCGGKSSRMGSDKGLLQINQVRWADYAKSKLEKYTAGSYVSIHSSQMQKYSQALQPNQYIVDVYENIGPLAGLLSAHKIHPSFDFFVLACDMVQVSDALMAKLYQSYIHTEGRHIVVYKNDTFYEPLMGIYPASELGKILHRFHQSKGTSLSLQSHVGALNSIGIDINEADGALLTSYNTPSALLSYPAFPIQNPS